MAKMVQVALFVAQNGRCFYCGVQFKGRQQRRSNQHNAQWTVDHVIPKSTGATISKNAVMACVGCNGKKKNRHPTADEIRRSQILHDRVREVMLAFHGSIPPDWASS